MKNKWSEKEDTILLEFYEQHKKEYLQELLPERSWDAIRARGVLKGLSRQKIGHHKTNITKLLDKSIESYYWLGFLMADGHFSKRGVISLHLNKLDKKHIEKYAFFINGNIREHNNKVIVDVQQPDICKSICQMFEVDNRKSYNCPILPEVNDDQFISFLAGLIDGDGSMDCRNGAIRIKCHISWANFYQQISNKIAKLSNTDIVDVNREKFCIFNICNLSVLSFLKSKAIKLNLPILARKWDKIDETKLSKYDNAKKLNKNVIELKTQGKTTKEIANLLGMSVSGVYSSLNRSEKYI